MDKKALLFLHALSPLHPGVGQGVGAVDLPVAREKATGIPYLPGSSLKGVLRDEARAWPKEEVAAVFGPETEAAHEHAAALQVGDAKLLLPVRSLYGLFAYATSPYLLRFRREAELVGRPAPEVPEPGEKALLAPKSRLQEGGVLYLEDLDLPAEELEAVQAWENYLAPLDLPIQGRLAVLPDNVMAFLLETATEVVARIRLEDDRKTVAQGALWYEENLPAETLLYSLLRAERARNGQDLSAEGVLAKVKGLLERPLQLGGKATVGRGLCRLVLWGV